MEDSRKVTISIVIPTLNEAEGIKKTISSIPIEVLKDMNFETEIIVVDSNSIDGTDKIARELGAHVIYEPKKGYGQAYKTGFKHAKGDIIITLDGDATYPAEYIPQLVDLLIKNNLDMITTQRIPEQGAMSIINKFGNYVLSIVIKLLFRINVKDSQSGMWVIRRNILNDIMPKSNDMGFSEEIKINAYLFKKRVYEFPIPYRNRIGKPKLRRFRDGLRVLLYIFVIFIELILKRRKMSA